ncbi:thiamine/thiamine pyrophosphate ABC transporter permease [Peteryoungia ipomoeae]|uniref:Thiamine transport system permease protein ThiP n=1 Tax=Peteryoungia ipomoeae TaxID=1210932 RepID=A0A4S8NZF5_9HYPH|nr:thiamine/thiamine pyrophosphate ABC transporter permease [Peteryoungia ipomoeae]THV22245.1 thiamine/thiamine pyrophosphate ABC transporter, permease protein [Peteryoungia ipomoeae]
MVRPLHQSWSRRLPALAGGLVVLGLIAAFVGTALVSLVAGQDGAGVLSVIADPVNLALLRFTLWQAFLSTLLSVGCAVFVAIALARQPSFPGRRWLIRLMAVPMGLPALIGALGLLGIFGRQGLVNQGLAFLGLSAPVSIYGLTGILIAHVFFNLPLATRLLISALERVPAEQWRMAASLGFSPLSSFRFIEWPALMRVIPGAAGLVFMLCATSFTLVLVFGGGPAATTLEVAIYQALRFSFDPARAVTLASMQLVLTGIVLMALALLPGAEDSGPATGRRVPRFDGRHPAMRAIDGILILMAALFLILPLAQVVVAGLTSDLLALMAKPAFQTAALTSLTVALCAGIIATLSAYGIVAARSLTASGKGGGSFGPRLFSASLAGASSLVLLVPTTVLATGWFLVLRPYGDIQRYAPFVVIGINALMALPFATRVLEPAYRDHRLQTARLSESLGLSVWQRMRLVDWPVLRRPFLAALTFAMALSLGDLGAVALFGSENISTLPTLIHATMGSYRSRDADGLALLLGALCLLLALFGAPAATRKETRHE